MERETLYWILIIALIFLSSIGLWVLRWHRRRLMDLSKPPRGGRDLLADLKYPAVFRTKRFGCPECGSEVHIQDDSCPVCGTDFDGDELRCPKCRARATLSQVECSRCGEILDTDPFFCPECGEIVAPTVKGCDRCGAEFWSPIRRKW